MDWKQYMRDKYDKLCIICMNIRRKIVMDKYNLICR